MLSRHVFVFVSGPGTKLYTLPPGVPDAYSKVTTTRSSPT